MRKNCTVRLFLGKRVKKSYFEEQSLEIGKNNYAKVNLPVLAGYYVHQTQNDIEAEPISYADMMIL